MALSFCVLGSGSGGNSTLVVCEHGKERYCFLVDCGLSIRATATRLATIGHTLDDIRAIVVTHFDTDHFYSGWLKVIERRNLPIYVHRRHRHAAWHAGLTAAQATIYANEFNIEAGASVSPLLLAHDALGSVGFVIEHSGLRLGYATDLGRVPHELFDHFTNLDALAIESNYDRDMQMTSGRPAYLKRRIMGGRGHLSNAQSLEAVYRIAESSALSHIALLHLSRECNDPRIVRGLYEGEASPLLPRLTITCQHTPTPLLPVHQTSRHSGLSPRSRPLPVPAQLTLF